MLRTLFIAIATLSMSACLVDDEPAPTELVADPGKADGSARASLALGADRPYAKYTVQCDETFSCDLKLRVETPLTSLRAMYRAYFLAHGGAPLEHDLYKITVTSELLDKPRVAVVDTGIEWQNGEVVFAYRGQPYPDDRLIGELQMNVADYGSPLLIVELRLADELVRFAESVSWQPTLAGTVVARWW